MLVYAASPLTCKLCIDAVHVACDATNTESVKVRLANVSKLHNLQCIGIAVCRIALEAPEVHKVLCCGILS
jgi:predicted acetyltransferase